MSVSTDVESRRLSGKSSADRQAIGIRNNVQVRGSGTRPMLFAHGFGGAQTLWRFVTPAFEPHYRVHLLDYVGCGKSDRSAYDPGRYRTIDGYVQDVLEIIDACDLCDVVFVGHSVGAMIGLLASIRRPERFARLVLVGPSPRYINEPGYVGGFERGDIDGLLGLMDARDPGWPPYLSSAALGSAARPELVQEMQEGFAAMDPRATAAFARVTFLSDNRAALAEVTVPSLILQSSEDAIAPRVVGEYLHRALPGSTLRLMSATGHCPHLSHPAETVALMKEYLGT